MRSSHTIYCDLSEACDTWEMARLGDIAMILSGIAPSPPATEEVRYVQIKDLDPERRALVAGARPTAGRASAIEHYDVLIAARGERNIAIRPQEDLVGAYPALDIYLIRPDAQRVDPDFLAAFLGRPKIGAALRASTAGASLPRIPKEALTDLEIPLPPLHRQRAIGGLAACAWQQSLLNSRLHAAEARLAAAHLSHAFQQLEA